VKALYRKYRPTKLTDVVGQEQVTSSLIESLEQGKINHAYVFAGPRGTGKTSVARIFAHAVNNFEYQLEDDYLDIIEIDAASNNGVDNIRELREKAIIAPAKGKYKVYIIDEAHMLTKSAANALLKLLEEPPEHVIFVMATTEIDKIPITILSRTQVYTFSLAGPELMLSHLQKIAKAENINIDQSGLEIVVKRGGGSFRDSLSLLDQVATLTDEKITAAVLEKALGIPSQEKVKSLLEAYKAKNADKIEQLFKDLLGSGLRAENIASELLTEIITHPEAKTLSLLKSLPEVAPPFAEAKLLLALLEDCLEKPATPSIPKPEAKPEIIATAAAQTSNASASTTTHDTKPAESEPAITEPEIAVQPAETVTKNNTTDFDWDDFVHKVAEIDAGASKPLAKSKFEFEGGTLHIYPDNSFTARILKNEKHSKILRQALSESGLQIHDTPKKSAQPKDETIAKISAIMGDVQEIDGAVPF